MVYQADRPETLLEVLAEAGGISSDAGDTVIVARPVQDAQPDTTEPPAIGPEQQPPATVPADATMPSYTPHSSSDPVQTSHTSGTPNNAPPISSSSGTA